MITKYFTNVVVKFNPVGKEGKVARVFLSSIPPSMRGVCKIDSKVLTTESTVKPVIQVTFNKKTIEANPQKMSVEEVSDLFDRHSRQLQVKESLQR